MALLTRNPDNRVTGSDFLGTLSLVEVFFDFFLAEPWRMRFEETISKTIVSCGKVQETIWFLDR